MLKKLIGPINTEFSYELFSLKLKSKRSTFFFLEKDPLIIVRIIFRLQQLKFGPKPALLLFFVQKEHSIVSNGMNPYSLLVKSSKINAAFW